MSTVAEMAAEKIRKLKAAVGKDKISFIVAVESMDRPSANTGPGNRNTRRNRS